MFFEQYAANPGRFVISEVKQDEENDTQLVSIRATYPFGNIDIEKIEVKPLNSDESSTEPKSRTSAPTKVIKTTTISEVAVIGNDVMSLPLSFRQIASLLFCTNCFVINFQRVFWIA